MPEKPVKIQKAVERTIKIEKISVINIKFLIIKGSTVKFKKIPIKSLLIWKNVGENR